MDVTAVIEENEDFKRHVANLRKQSPYYPELFYSNIRISNGGRRLRQSISTIVRIFRNDQWYAVHLVEDYHWDEDKRKPVNRMNALEKLMMNAHFIQHIYNITESTELDSLQISEQERVIELVNKLKL